MIQGRNAEVAKGTGSNWENIVCGFTTRPFPSWHFSVSVCELQCDNYGGPEGPMAGHGSKLMGPKQNQTLDRREHANPQENFYMVTNMADFWKHIHHNPQALMFPYVSSNSQLNQNDVFVSGGQYFLTDFGSVWKNCCPKTKLVFLLCAVGPSEPP